MAAPSFFAVARNADPAASPTSPPKKLAGLSAVEKVRARMELDGRRMKQQSVKTVAASKRAEHAKLRRASISSVDRILNASSPLLDRAGAPLPAPNGISGKRTTGAQHG